MVGCSVGGVIVWSGRVWCGVVWEMVKLDL